MTEKECWITRRISNHATAIQIKPHDVGKNTRLIMSWYFYMPYCKEAFLSERQPSAVNAGSRERENEKKKILLFYPVVCVYMRSVLFVCLSVLLCLFIFFLKYISFNFILILISSNMFILSLLFPSAHQCGLRFLAFPVSFERYTC